MWLIPFLPGLDHVVTIRFDRAESIAGLRFWNYNKSPEDTYRGVSWGTAAALGPLSGKQRLDEWLVWLLERSINPPELSKWIWGRLPLGSERAAAVSFFCKQQMQAKEPRADSGNCSASWPPGTQGSSAGPPTPRPQCLLAQPWFPESFGNHVWAEGFSHLCHFTGPTSQPLGGRCYYPHLSEY